MNPWPQVDFKELVEDVCRSQCGRHNLTILGGQCAENDLLNFFNKWDLAGMPFRVWEYVSEVVFEKGTLPQNIALLKRGRIFGEGGDLMLHRNGTAFDWRLIGPAGIRHPTGEYGTRDYWEYHPEVSFHQYNEKALLWGKWNGKCWAEDRVAVAKLNYPATGRRIQLHYQVFSYAGRVRFVWYTGLSEWKEDDHAERDD